jgi:hypothetical protein
MFKSWDQIRTSHANTHSKVYLGKESRKQQGPFWLQHFHQQIFVQNLSIQYALVGPVRRYQAITVRRVSDERFQAGRLC